MLKSKLIVVALAVMTAFSCQAVQGAESDLLPSLRPYVAKVVKEFDQIPEDRKADLKKIALFVKSKIGANETAQLTFICTHNSRRSHLAASWAQAAAAYYDVAPVKTFSGGIQVTAFNIRAVDALRRAGFDIAVSGTASVSGTGSNPVYLVKYSDKADPLRAFSKLYNTEGNPTENYLAAMTCSNADKNCPVVEGSSVRVGIHYEDPKESDGKPNEQAVYDERCEQIAREMFYLMSLVKS